MYVVVDDTLVSQRLWNAGAVHDFVALLGGGFRFSSYLCCRYTLIYSMETANQKEGRLQSLDALRGFDMFFIMGGEALFLTLGALFPGTWMEAWGRQMLHVPWNGFAFEDLIFPLFLFLAGVSFPFSLAKQRASGKSEAEIYGKILRRGATLVLLGVVYNGLLQFDFATLRYASVLGRIGLGWMLAACMAVKFGPKVRVGVSVFLLCAYWLLLATVEAPDAPGAGSLTMEGSIVGYVDRMWLPGRLHVGIHDPEGLLSTLPAVVTALLGIFAGEFIRSMRVASGTRKALFLLGAGVLLALLGQVWNLVFPINKNLWSSSFVCWAGGLSLMLLAGFYYVVDVLQWRRWTFFFTVIGVNSITIYLAQEFVNFSWTSRALFGGVIPLFPEQWQGVVGSVAYIVVCWLFLYVLYRKKIFLKV